MDQAKTQNAILEIVQPAYITDIKNAVEGRRVWKKISDVCEASSKICAGAASVLAFSSGVYDFKELSFASGCVGTASIVFSVFSNYASGESRERTIRLNTTLNHVGLSSLTMPVIKDDAQGSAPPSQDQLSKVASIRANYERQFTIDNSV